MLNFLSQAARKSVSSVTSVVGGTRFARAGGHSDPPLQRGTRIGDPTARRGTRIDDPAARRGTRIDDPAARRGAMGHDAFMDTFMTIHAHSCCVADRILLA